MIRNQRAEILSGPMPSLLGMSRLEKLRLYESGEVFPVAYFCGNDECGYRFERVKAAGFEFEIAWSNCYSSVGGGVPIRDLISDMFSRELGLSLAEEEAVREIFRARGAAQTPIPLAVSGHYTRRLVCLRDVVHIPPKRRKLPCHRCGRKAVIRAHGDGWNWFYKTLSTDKWIDGICPLPHQQSYYGPKQAFCSVDCHLEGEIEQRLVWRKKRAEEIKAKREMKWIQRAKTELKAVRRYLSQPDQSNPEVYSSRAAG
jgi:hypothetical protein